ncbi:hypothetical protein [Mycobacterium sp. HNNTM2301]|uniref:hypothetical protein n=1 Tax=Mycobacterium hainanense TaxID=3289775 RepID=UPI0035A69829
MRRPDGVVMAQVQTPGFATDPKFRGVEPVGCVEVGATKEARDAEREVVGKA